jgi:hypothetical protein
VVINITITNKKPVVLGTPVIVCGNKDYTISFAFDAAWSSYTDKTARFVFKSPGTPTGRAYIDVPFSGNSVAVPQLSNLREVYVGVYAGDLYTTTPARIFCDKSILCESGTRYVDSDECLDIIEQWREEMAAAAQAVETSKTEAATSASSAAGSAKQAEGAASSAAGSAKQAEDAASSAEQSARNAAAEAANAAQTALAEAKASGQFDGEKGDPFTYEDFTPEQLENLRGPKGEDGTMTFEELTDEQKATLKGDKGDKGDPFTYADFTAEQLATLKGEKGDKGDKGDSIKGDKGDKGDTGATGPQGPAYALNDTDKNTIAAAVKASLASEPLTFHYEDGTQRTIEVYVK